MSGVRLCRRTLLCEQHLQRREHHLQELSLCRVRNAWHKLFDRWPLLPRQHLHEWLLCQPLQQQLVEQSLVHSGRFGLRHPDHEHEQPGVRLDHGRGRLLHRQRHDHPLRWPWPSLLCLKLLFFDELLLLWRPWQPLPFQYLIQHAVPVHNMRRQGPALLCRQFNLEHELGSGLQVSLPVHL